MSSVSVIIVSHNGRALLEPCLAALFAGSRTPDEVIVVDNASTDDSVPWLRQMYPNVRLLPCAVNLGFAAANNLGMEAARGSLLMTLNNDTEIDPDALDALARALDTAGARVGAAMSTMVFAQRPDIVASRGLEVFTDGLVRDAGVGEGYCPDAPPYPIFGASAGAALYRREALDDVGRFDPAFFMYLEDADLAWRLRLRRWETVTVPRATVRHVVSGTAGYGSPRKAYYLARNRWWCLLKNMPAALLRRNTVPIGRYDAAAIAYALVTGDRASLAGRRAAIADLSAILAARRRIQARATATDDAIAAWLKPAPPLLTTLQERRTIARLIRS